MSVPTRRILDPIFGEPVLRYQNNGMAGWCRENSLTQGYKGGGWTANLYGGLQTGSDDWAAVFIPVNEMKLADLKDALWSYYMTSNQTMGVNMVIWVHDPNDFDKRAELTQAGGLVERTSGWDSHELDITTDQFFFYGENTTGTNLDSDSTKRYGLDDYQSDDLFQFWTIYRISFEYGWEASGTFDDVWVSEISINGQRILLKPSAGDHIGGEVKTYTKATASGASGTRATLVTPATAKRIRVISVNCTTDNPTPASFEVYFGTGSTLWANPASAIFHTRLAAGSAADKPGYPTDSIVFPTNSQPVGAIDEVVSIRTSMEIDSGGNVLITYREE